MKMGRIHPRKAVVDDVGDGPGRTPHRRQHADEDEDLQDVADGPHAPAAQAHDLAGPKAQTESVPGKAQQTEGQSPQQGCARGDAQGQPTKKQRYDDGVHGHDSIPRSPGPVKRFSAGKALPRRQTVACLHYLDDFRQKPVPALLHDEKPGPSYKEAGLIFFFPSAGSPSQRRNLGASSPLPCTQAIPQTVHRKGQDTVNPPPAPSCRRRQPHKSSTPATRKRDMPTAPCRRTLSGLPPPG